MIKPQLALGLIVLAATSGLSASPYLPKTQAEGEAVSFDRDAGDESVEKPFIAGGRFTPFDLLARTFTDLTPRGEYRKVEPVGLVADAASSELRRGKDIPADQPALTMPSPSKAVIRSGPNTWGFVLGGDVLVADRLAPAPGNSDALYVRTDSEGTATVVGAMVIGEQTPAALVLNGHSFQGGDYQSYMIVAQRGGRLQEVYRGLELHSVTLPDGDCAGRRHSQALTELRPLKTSHFGYADLAVTVTETSECATDARKETPQDKLFRYTLKWRIGIDRYEGGSPELDRLNSQRLGM
ncbi:MAG: hypothetical protein AB7F98_18440 [Novosphingobium sp.]